MAKEDADLEAAFNDLCMCLLSVPLWYLGALVLVPIRLCDGVQKKSLFAKGRPSYKITLASFSEPYSQGRACHYRNFARQEKIIRDLEYYQNSSSAPLHRTLWQDLLERLWNF